MNLSALNQTALNKLRNLQFKVVDFVQKGAQKRKTKIKLKDLTEARLKKIPNYIAVEVAKKRIEVTKDAAILGLLGLLIILSYLVLSFSSRLDERIVTLIPSRVEQVTEVQPGKISPAALYWKISSYVSLLGNIDYANVDFNYELMRDVMTDDLKVKFWADSTQLRSVVKNKEMSQTVSFDMNDMDISTKGKVISALVKVRVKPMYGDEVGKIREEYLLLEGAVVVKKEDNFWQLELFNIEQGPIKDIAQVKRRVSGGFE
ncbi:MAG: hypothetical protein CL676_03615 [Bdellovibrionaceae bacterium]|nr:hypothetical protein [Pseudobdellovibrionaceae bacterium]